MLGLRGALAEGPEQEPHFLLLLLLSAYSVSASGVQRISKPNSDALPYSGWTKSEKALTEALWKGYNIG